MNDDLYFMAHTYRASEGKSEGKRRFPKSRRKRKYPIKIQLTETGRESVDLIQNGLGYRNSGGLLYTRQWKSQVLQNARKYLKI